MKQGSVEESISDQKRRRDWIALDKELERLASAFYRRERVKNPRLCAQSFVWACDDFVANVKGWVQDLPEHHPNQREKGRVQPLPSQRRKDVVPELHQLADFLDANLKLARAKRFKITTLRGRRRLSVWTCKELLGGIRRPLRVPRRRLGRRRRRRDLNARDIRLIRRSFAIAAKDASIKTYSLIIAKPARLLPSTAKTLSDLSDGFARPVPIVDFVQTLDKEALRNLAKRARLAALELQSAAQLWKRDSQLNRTVTDLDQPAPIYRWLTTALEIGWKTMTVPPEERQRLMSGDKSSNPFEGRFSKFVTAAMKLMPKFARVRYEVSDFDPLVGTDAAWVIKRKRTANSKSRDARRSLAPKVAGDFAVRIVRHREQIVILGDLAETMNRWSDKLTIQARSNPDIPKLTKERDFFQQFARNPVTVWRKDCEDQYRRGIFYSSDARDRGNNRLVESLDVDMLRSSYLLGSGASRFANINGERMQKLLARLHSTLQVRTRLKEILKRFPRDEGVSHRRYD